jgi:hypothetical protein
MTPIRSFAIRCLACAGICFACNLPAADVTGYSLTLERDSSSLRIDDAAVATIRERIGIRIEEAYPTRTRLGLTLGQVFFTQRRYPTAAGTDGGGYFLRLDADQNVYTSAAARLSVHGGYLFEQIYSGEDDADSVRLHTFVAGIGLSSDISPWISVGLHADAGVLSGVQSTDATNPARRDVEWNEQSGVGASIEFNVEQGGYVGIRGGTGIDRGFALYFARRL